jgi:hypothetical protein
MSDLSSVRRGVGEDVFVAVLLWVLDVIAGGVALLAGIGSADFNMFEPDPHMSTTPAFAYVAVFATVVLISAIGLYRLRYRVSAWGQIVASAAALAFCWTGFSGHLTL